MLSRREDPGSRSLQRVNSLQPTYVANQTPMVENRSSLAGTDSTIPPREKGSVMTSRLSLTLLAVLAVLASPLAAADKKKAKAVAKPGKTRSVKLRDITLAVPTSWKQEQPRSRLRAGQFKLPPVKGDQQPAELAVFFFGGAGGGADANIRRWKGQFQSKGRQAKVLRGESTQGLYLLLDVSGTYNQPTGPPIQGKTKPMPGARMLAVILAVKGKGNYFLKLTGSQKTVTAAAAALRVSFGADAKKEKPYSKDDKKKGDKKSGKPQKK
ncbi:MAG: hypothetical protein CMJ45_00100 [Planctomyces sp.]|jgi:hypothetical protein|nr:hypothetical protein [Planctomyces sp.]